MTSISRVVPFRSGPVRRFTAAALLVSCLGLPAAVADGSSARYKFEGNKWLSLDLAVGDVHAEQVKFEWPATLMKMKTGYKATVKVSNGSSRQVSIGLAIALYEMVGTDDNRQDAKLIGAGTTGTTLGTISPGDSAQFTIDFSHVTQKLDQAGQFGIALEVR